MDKIKKTNNHVFHYREFGKKNKKVILTLHGYADSAKMFNPLGKSLEDEYHVITLDFPMIYNQKKIENLNTLADYVTEFINLLKLEKFTLVGFSMGGLIAVECAYKNQKKVNKLILLNSFPQLFPRRRQYLLYQVIKPILKTKTAYRIASSILMKNNRQVRKNYISIFGTCFNVVGSKLFNKFISLPIKKTIVLFEDDKIVNPKKYKKLIKYLDCDLIVFPKGGHAVDRKSYWENVEKLWSKN